jgi:hypothetical protein
MGWFDRMLEGSRFVLLYGLGPVGAAVPELIRLTQGAFEGVSEIPGGKLEFAVGANLPGGPYPVAGLSFEVVSQPRLALAEGPSPAAAETLISVAGRAYFASVRKKQGEVFLLAEEGLVDIETPLTPTLSTKAYYPQLIALAVFFRGIYGSNCWTAPAIGANLVIDDPYLKPRYGFVDYQKLVGVLSGTGVSLTVAFIPFNYRRSNPRTVEMLRAIPDRFSIAIHGCDHTAAEFASGDLDWLKETTACALDRMEQHWRDKGMPFDGVMVFPQGKFSTTAITALKQCGLMAAVNSSAWPMDWRQNPGTIRDALEVAVCRFDSFPLFIRRYPRDLFDYAFDALFQKPVLGVEHHQYFRNGYSPLENLARDLARAIPNLQWMPLGRAVRSSHLVRLDGDGTSSIRHFVPELRHRNSTPRDMEYSVEKPESDNSVSAVRIDGKSVAFEIRSGVLRYSAVARAGQEFEAKVISGHQLAQRRKSPWGYRLRVSARRYLSDLRDNGLARADRMFPHADLPGLASRWRAKVFPRKM